MQGFQTESLWMVEVECQCASETIHPAHQWRHTEHIKANSCLPETYLITPTLGWFYKKKKKSLGGSCLMSIQQKLEMEIQTLPCSNWWAIAHISFNLFTFRLEQYSLAVFSYIYIPQTQVKNNMSIKHRVNERCATEQNVKFRTVFMHTCNNPVKSSCWTENKH